MIYLLDEGDVYGFAVVVVVEGDGNINEALEDYRAKRDRYTKDYNKCQLKVLKQIGPRPRHPKAAVDFKSNYAKWQKAYIAWNNKFNEKISELCSPAPVINDIMKHHGFNAVEFERVFIDGE